MPHRHAPLGFTTLLILLLKLAVQYVLGHRYISDICTINSYSGSNCRATESPPISVSLILQNAKFLFYIDTCIHVLSIVFFSMCPKKILKIFAYWSISHLFSRYFLACCKCRWLWERQYMDTRTDKQWIFYFLPPNTVWKVLQTLGKYEGSDFGMTSMESFCQFMEIIYIHREIEKMVKMICK